MVDDTRSRELTLPEEPWWTHGFISKIAAQVSLPYRKPADGVRVLVRQNGSLVVKFTTSEDCLPYGRYPRLFELWACTMIKTGNACFDPETNTLYLGTTFREFLRMIGVNVGGKSLRTIKPQLERLFACSYSISNNTKTKSNGVAFTVAKEWNIDWLRDEPQEHGLFENWVRLSPEYVDMLRDHPVPVDLKVIAGLRKPMALDVYWWLTKRVYNMREPVTLTWQQLYQQFGSDSSTIRKFKQSFKDAVFEVMKVYAVEITLGPQRVTIFPSATSVPTVMETRSLEAKERREQHKAEAAMASADQRKPREQVEGHWIEVATPGGIGRVWWTSKAFDASLAQNHLLDQTVRGACPVCRFDERNRDAHGQLGLF